MRKPGSRCIKLDGDESDSDIKLKQLSAVHNILNETLDGCGYNRACIGTLMQLIYEIIVDLREKSFRENKTDGPINFNIHKCGLKRHVARKLSFEYNIEKLDELTKFTEHDILKMPGMGPQALHYIRYALASFGLSLKNNGTS
jgi:DNA-directed RNA polymerase alpha subunit